MFGHVVARKKTGLGVNRSKSIAMVVRELMGYKAPPILILICLLTIWNAQLHHKPEFWLHICFFCLVGVPFDVFTMKNSGYPNISTKGSLPFQSCSICPRTATSLKYLRVVVKSHRHYVLLLDGVLLNLIFSILACIAFFPP